MSEKLEEFLRRKQLEGQGAARTMVENARGVSPEEAARRERYRRTYGVEAPKGDVLDDFPQLRSFLDGTDEDLREALEAAKNPRVAAWYARSPNNAALARGGHAQLADVSTAIGKAGEPRELGGINPLSAMGIRFGRNLRKAFFAGDITGGNIKRSLQAGLSEQIMADGVGGTLQFALQTLGFDDNDKALQFVKDRREGYEKLGQVLTPETETQEGRAILQGVKSAPLSVGALAAGVLSGGSAWVAAGTIGVPTFGGSYARARDEGLGYWQSTLYGGIDASIEVATERLTYLKALDGNSSVLKRIGGTLLNESVGEQFATLGQDLNAWVNIDSNKGKTFGDFLAERPGAAYETAIAALVTSGAITTASEGAHFAANKIGRRIGRAQNAAQTKRFTDALSQLTKANTVLTRDRTSFEEFVRTAAEGTEATDVFIAAEQLGTVLDQSDLTVEETLDLFGMTPEQLQQAIARGDDVQIPVEQYAARIAPHALGEQLADHIRINPDDMTVSEAETFMQGAKEEFAQEAERGMIDADQRSERNASRAAVEGRILADLQNARRFTDDTNEVYASIVGAFFDTQAAKVGISAEELFERYQLRVQSGEVQDATYDQEGDPFDNVEGLLDRGDWAVMTAENPNAQQLGEEENAARNEQLREDLRAMGLSFREVKGKYGNDENSIAISGITREQAMELGAKYGQESVLTRDGLVYADGTVNPARGVSRVGEEQEDFFSTLDDGTRFAVDIDFDQRFSVDTIEIDGVRRSTVNSDGQPLAQTEEGVRNFWAWFGDSKVVDEQGRPLVVYHGTAIPKEAFRGQNGMGEGAYFAVERSLAEEYAEMDVVEEGDTPEVVAAYISVSQPFRMNGTEGQSITPEKKAEITAQGGDGVFNYYDDSLEEVVAFDPTQIKSVNNRGAFDPADPSILNQSPLPPEEAVPGYAGVSAYLTDEERAPVRAAMAARIMEVFETLPDAEEMASVAFSGRAKRGWYERSAQALIQVFGIEDAPRFAALLAALSPQTSVESNTINALATWVNWEKAGRPTDRSKILKVLGKSVQGGKGLGSVLNAWIDNSVRALTQPNPMDIQLSGPKVNSFMLNLIGVMDEVTNDTWMANYSRIAQEVFRARRVKDANTGGLIGVKGPGYLAMNALVRRAAEIATERTGETWTPAEVQETVWSWAKALTEKTQGTSRSATEILQMGGLTEQDIANTPDFAQLFVTGFYREFLVRMGYGQEVAALEAGKSPAGPQGGTGSVTSPEGFTIGEEQFAQHLANAASRIDERLGRSAEVITLNQDAPTDPLVIFKRESFYPQRAVRHEDGKVYADVPTRYPDRLARIAEQLGAEEVIGVEENDPRLDEGVPLWFDRPPLNVDGTITLHHWGPSGLTVTDPTRWGESGSLPKSERQSVSGSLPRTYFGIASGQPGGYVIEFPSRTQYETRIPAGEIYDIMGDPDGLKPAGSDDKLEKKVKAAGYKGYWRQHPQLGLVAVVFDPVALEPAGAQTLHQDAVFYSALERAVEQSKTNKAPAAQWKATLEKTPGVKQDELDWTGLLDFLAMNEGPIEKDALLELLREGGIQIEEVLLGEPPVVEPIGEDGWAVRRSPGGELVRAFNTRQEAEDEARSMRSERPVQFQSWSNAGASTPWGKSYRELLITLPPGRGRNPSRSHKGHWSQRGVIAHVRFYEAQDANGKITLVIDEVQSDWHQTGRKQGYEEPPTPEMLAKVTALETRIADLEAVLGEVEADESKALQELTSGARDFIMGSYERWAAENEARVEEGLVSREVMEKAQESLKATTGVSFYETADLSEGLMVDLGTMRGWIEFAERAGAELPAEVQAMLDRATKLSTEKSDVMRTISLRRNELGQERRALQSGVPNAPFRTGWPELVMKRMIRWAADHGYEQVAWTPGEQHAKRYNLSQAVGSIQHSPSQTEGVWRVRLDEERAGSMLVQNGLADWGDMNFLEMEEAQLREAFGGQIAEQIMGNTGADPGVVAEKRKALEDAQKAESEWKEKLAVELRANGAPDGVINRVAEFLDRNAPTSASQVAGPWLAASVGGTPIEVADALYDELITLQLAITDARGELNLAEMGLRTIEGDGLSVGGAGMKAFYDKNLVNITNKLIKKSGAKVGVIGIDRRGGVSEDGRNEDDNRRWRLDREYAKLDDATSEIEQIKRETVERQTLLNGNPADDEIHLNRIVQNAQRAEYLRGRFIPRVERNIAFLEQPGVTEREFNLFDTINDEQSRIESINNTITKTRAREDLDEDQRASVIQDLRLNLDEAQSNKTEAEEILERMTERREAENEKARNDPHWGFEVNEKLAETALGGFPLFQKEKAPRAQIRMNMADLSSMPSTITLLRGADLSSFLHELGHFFFEVTNDMASRPDAPQQVRDDRDTLLRYLGVTSVSEWQQRTPEQRREGHERIARSFEAYLFEGRAPSPEMRTLFSKLRGWMLQVYRTISRLNVELTDEVRGVFDRMLASEDAIREAEADLDFAAAFTEKPEGMTESEWEDYQKLDEEARVNAAETLERRSLRDMKFAGKAVAREIKRLQAQVADQRASVREEVEAEIRALPLYRAIEFFRTGKVNGEETTGPHKLDSDEVKRILEIEGRLPKAFSGMTKKGELDPTAAAELLGWSSADHLLKDILFAPPVKDAIEAETDARMKERYGDLNTPEEVAEAARAAVHNDVRGRMVATELAAISGAQGRRRVLTAAAKQLAADMVSRLRIRDLRPGQYEAAERRAAKAAVSGQNLDEAVRHKRNQLFQFHAAKAVHEAREETKRARDYLRKFENKGTRQNLDPDYLDQIDKLLERYELRTISNREADRRKSLAKWIEDQRAMGFEPAIDEATLQEIRAKSWRDLTVEEMRGLLDAVRNIEHIARLTKKLLTAKDKADLNQAAGEMAASVRDNAFKTRDEIIGAKSWWERVQSGARDYFAMHRKVGNLAYVFDGNKYGGAFWERFVRPMNERGDWEATRVREANERIAAVFKQIAREDTSKRRYYPAIGKSLSLEDRLMFALNWGNSANRQRLLDGDKLEEDQVMEILGTLEAHHWDFVEGVWAEVDSYWPEIAAKERRVSGVEPEKVQAEPFQIEIDGELRLITGGYFPIKYDPDRSTRAEADNAAEIQRQLTQGLYTRATTRRGHTKARVEEVNRPLQKTFGVIFNHVNTVIHDLAWHEYLIDANRLLRHPEVDTAIREHYGPETLRWIRKALEDIAVGDLAAQDAFEQAINYLRNGVTIAGLGWSLWTSFLQPIGLTQSMSRIGTKHVMKGLGGIIGSPKAMNDKLNWIYETSPFMRERGNTMQREINEIRNRIKAKSPLRKQFDKVIPQGISSAVGDSYFYFIAKAQLMADVPTWLGQYERAMSEGADADSAARQADQAVLDSQSGGQIKDLAGIQRGSPLMRLWTNFYSYFAATFNLMVDRSSELRRVGPRDLPYYAVDMMLLTVVPATITSIMYGVLRGGWLDGDDEPEDIAAAIAGDNISYLLGTMIGLRELGAAFTGNAGYSGPAGARAFAELNRFATQSQQGEVDEALLRSANATAGILLHYPAGQIDRSVRGSIEAAKGEAGPQAVLLGPPPN